MSLNNSGSEFGIKLLKFGNRDRDSGLKANYFGIEIGSRSWMPTSADNVRHLTVSHSWIGSLKIHQTAYKSILRFVGHAGLFSFYLKMLTVIILIQSDQKLPIQIIWNQNRLKRMLNPLWRNTPKETSKTADKGVQTKIRRKKSVPRRWYHKL